MYESKKDKSIQEFRYAKISKPVYQYVSMQVCMSPSIQICKNFSMKYEKSAGFQVCNNATM